MAIGFILTEYLPDTGKKLSDKFNKVWVFAEILLFVLVGAEVNVNVALKAGGIGNYIDIDRFNWEKRRCCYFFTRHRF